MTTAGARVTPDGACRGSRPAWCWPSALGKVTRSGSGACAGCAARREGPQDRRKDQCDAREHHEPAEPRWSEVNLRIGRVRRPSGFTRNESGERPRPTSAAKRRLPIAPKPAEARTPGRAWWRWQRRQRATPCGRHRAWRRRAPTDRATSRPKSSISSTGISAAYLPSWTILTAFRIICLPLRTRGRKPGAVALSRSGLPAHRIPCGVSAHFGIGTSPTSFGTL